MATQTEMAEHLDLSERRIRDLMTAGILAKGSNLDESRVAYIRYLREQAAGRAPETGEGGLITERTRLAKAQADKIELETAKLRGDLVSVEATEQEWSEHIATARARLLSLPSQAAASLAGKVPRAEVQELVRRVVYQALEDLASGSEDEQAS